MNRNVQNKKIKYLEVNGYTLPGVRKQTENKIYFGKKLKNGLTTGVLGCILH